MAVMLQESGGVDAPVRRSRLPPRSFYKMRAACVAGLLSGLWLPDFWGKEALAHQQLEQRVDEAVVFPPQLPGPEGPLCSFHLADRLLVTGAGIHL